MRAVRSKPYYGWYIAVTLAVTETISWGILYYAFSVFLAPMEAELGWTRAELTGGFSLMWLMSGLLAYPVGAWIDKHGARGLMSIGAIAASILVIAWSQVNSLPAFYAIWAGLGMCAAAVLYEPAFAVIAAWFQRRRGAALAIVTFAAGFASTIFLPLTDALLRAFGWRTAVLILGIFLACITVPLHALMLRRRPADLSLRPDGAPVEPSAPHPSAAAPEGVSFRDALRGRVFWWVTAGFALASLSAAGIRVHFIPFLISEGVDSSIAATATGLIGAMQVAGRIAFAPLDRRFSSRTIVVGVFALQTAALGLLLIGRAPALLLIFIVIFGAAQGAFTLTRPAILAELYGSAHYGRISSILALCLTLTSTAAPLGASLVYDQAGTYQPVLWIVVGLGIAATGIALVARRSGLRKNDGDQSSSDMLINHGKTELSEI
jgi:MFS family permease